MSKIGKKPIVVPSGVEVTLTASGVKVKGPKATLEAPLSPLVQVKVADNKVVVKRMGNAIEDRSVHGLTRALLNNMIQGVTKGFSKKLEIIGVGYRAQATGKKITLSLGFSHPLEYHSPEGVNIAMDEENKNIIVISGADRKVVGQVAAHLRGFKPPEPYKGKGIRYVDEYVPRKTGKAAVSTTE